MAGVKIDLKNGYEIDKAGKIRKSLKTYDVAKRLRMKASKKVRVGKR
jgi:hypothetical protein